MSTTTNTGDEEDFKITRVIGNEILYYGEITNEDILEFVEEFKKLDADAKASRSREQQHRQPWLWANAITTMSS